MRCVWPGLAMDTAVPLQIILQYGVAYVSPSLRRAQRLRASSLRDFNLALLPKLRVHPLVHICYATSEIATLRTGRIKTAGFGI